MCVCNLYHPRLSNHLLLRGRDALTVVLIVKLHVVCMDTWMTVVIRTCEQIKCVLDDFLSVEIGQCRIQASYRMSKQLSNVPSLGEEGSGGHTWD